MHEKVAWMCEFEPSPRNEKMLCKIIHLFMKILQCFDFYISEDAPTRNIHTQYEVMNPSQGLFF